MKKSNPLVSVIITTREEEKYIGRCLKAIKNQTYKPIEIIVSDAESKDKTVKIARKYGGKVVVKKTTIPEGRNLGALHSRGKILTFMDADTTLSRNWIEKAVEDLSDKKVDGVVGIFRPLEKSLRARIICYIWSDAMPAFLRIFGVTYNAGGSVPTVKREMFAKVGGFNEKIKLAEDADFVNRLSKKGRVLWDRKLVAKNSMRRLEKDGYLKWIIFWFITGLSVLLFRKSPFDNYKVIR